MDTIGFIAELSDGKSSDKDIDKKEYRQVLSKVMKSVDQLKTDDYKKKVLNAAKELI